MDDWKYIEVILALEYLDFEEDCQNALMDKRNAENK